MRRFRQRRLLVAAALIGLAVTLITAWAVPFFERPRQIPGPNQSAVIHTASGRQGSWGIELHRALCSTFVVVRPVDMHVRPLEGVDAFAKLRELAPDWARTPTDARPQDVLSFAAGWPFRACSCEMWGASSSISPSLEWAVRMDPARGGPVVLPYRPLLAGLAADWAIWTVAAAIVLWCLGRLRSARRLRWGRCPMCDYDLGGKAAAGCPECGWGRGTTVAASTVSP